MMDENTTESENNEHEEIPNEGKDVTEVTSEEFFKNAPPMVKDDELPLEKDQNEETKDVEQTTEQVHQEGESTEENVDKIEEIEQEVILSETDKKSDEEDEKVLQGEPEENITTRDSEFEGAPSTILEDTNLEYEYNEEDEIQKLKFTEMEYAYEEMEEEYEDEFEMDYLQEVGKEIEDIYLQPFYRKGMQDDMSEKDFNIFGEPRASQLGPVVSFSSGSGEEEALPEHDSFMNVMKTDITGYAIMADKIDRDIYTEEYNKLVTQRGNLRRKNGYLNKKIAEYYFKRKVEFN